MKTGALSELAEELKLFFMRFISNGFKFPTLWNTGNLRNDCRHTSLFEVVDRCRACCFRSDFAVLSPQSFLAPLRDA